MFSSPPHSIYDSSQPSAFLSPISVISPFQRDQNLKNLKPLKVFSSKQNQVKKINKKENLLSSPSNLEIHNPTVNRVQLYAEYLDKENSSFCNNHVMVDDTEEIWKKKANYFQNYFQQISQNPIPCLTPEKNSSRDLAFLKTFIPSKWTILSHRNFPTEFRLKVFNLLLIWHRPDTILSLLPKHILYNIIDQLAILEYDLSERTRKKKKKHPNSSQITTRRRKSFLSPSACNKKRKGTVNPSPSKNLPIQKTYSTRKKKN